MNLINLGCVVVLCLAAVSVVVLPIWAVVLLGLGTDLHYSYTT
jgi:hypothetical protein